MSSPWSIKSADFNNDGNLDLAVVHLGSDNFSILLGTGGGNFSIPTNFAVNRAFSIEVGDFNNDNNMDVVTPDENANQVSVFFGDGNANFSAPTNFSVGMFPRYSAVGDLNADGNSDLVVANDGLDNDISVLLGDGIGGFSASKEFPVQPGPVSIALSDLNDDGAVDIAVSNFANDTISLLIGIPAFSNNQFTAPRGDFSTLTKNNDETFTRTLKDGTNILFDANGLQTSIVNRNGNTTSYLYNNGLLTNIVDPVGFHTKFVYVNGLLQSITDPASRETSFLHDSNGNLISITDPDGTSRHFNYDQDNLMLSQVNKRGFTTTYVYDDFGRNIQAIRPDGSIWKVSPSQTVGLIKITPGSIGTQANPAPLFRPGDVIASLTDGNGFTSRYVIDRFGTNSAFIDAQGNQTITEKDKDGNPTRITDPNGNGISMVYDNRGNLLNYTEESSGSTTIFSYEPNLNQLASITEPDGVTATTLSYDANGNLIEIKDELGTKVTLGYTPEGIVSSITDNFNNVTQYTHNNKGNIITAKDPLNNMTSFTYDLGGNILTTLDAEGIISTYTYDIMNQLTQMKDALNGTIVYTYDSEGNTSTATDLNGNQTSYVYDSMNRLTQTNDPLELSTNYSYDNNGNIDTITDRNGNIILREYDALNQLVKKTLPNNLITTYSYDNLGNLTAINSPLSSLGFTYDAQSRIINATTNGSPFQPAVNLAYTYNSAGRLSTMNDGVMGITTYSYDALNRLTDIIEPTGGKVTYGYDVLSRRTSVLYSNNITASMNFNANNQLTQLTNKLGTTIHSDFSYGYNKIGMRTFINKTRANVNVNTALTYSYDNLYRLRNATNPLSTLPDEIFTYDAAGNMLRTNGQAIDAIYNTANQLIENENFTFNYDNNGNLIQKAEKSTSATTEYIFDAENQLIRIDLPDGRVVSYKYDGLGRRIEKNVDGTITRFIYNYDDILYEYDDTNQIIARYTHGAGIDEPLIMDRDINQDGSFESSERFSYQFDGLGNIIDMTDENGIIQQSYGYGAYGEINCFDSAGNNINVAPALINPYTFTGKQYDAESNLYYFRARYYDPSLGRFISQDPIGFAGQDVNLYRYVYNDPINLIDDNGLAPKWFQTALAVLALVHIGEVHLNQDPNDMPTRHFQQLEERKQKQEQAESKERKAKQKQFPKKKTKKPTITKKTPPLPKGAGFLRFLGPLSGFANGYMAGEAGLNFFDDWLAEKYGRENADGAWIDFADGIEDFFDKLNPFEEGNDPTDPCKRNF